MLTDDIDRSDSPQETYDQFKYLLVPLHVRWFADQSSSRSVNVFGGLNVARAFLPHMRQRKTGTIIWASSIVGWTYDYLFISSSVATSSYLVYQSAWDHRIIRRLEGCAERRVLMIAVRPFTAHPDSSAGISASLHSEISPLGLRSIAIDYGFYRTGILDSDNIRFSSGNNKSPDYKAILEGTEAFLKGALATASCIMSDPCSHESATRLPWERAR